MNLLVGMDFDNTLICYDQVFHEIALAEGLIPPSIPFQKTEIRDYIRRSAAGDQVWQQLQVRVYGPEISRAHLYDGVKIFFEGCHLRGVKIVVVSHKTRDAMLDGMSVSLRQYAMEWMERQGFFGSTGLRLHLDQVFFEDSRWKKIDRIRSLGCTHFVDDLPEFFSAPASGL